MVADLKLPLPKFAKYLAKNQMDKPSNHKRVLSPQDGTIMGRSSKIMTMVDNSPLLRQRKSYCEDMNCEIFSKKNIVGDEEEKKAATLQSVGTRLLVTPRRRLLTTGTVFDASGTPQGRPRATSLDLRSSGKKKNSKGRKKDKIDMSNQSLISTFFTPPRGSRLKDQDDDDFKQKNDDQDAVSGPEEGSDV